MADIFMNTYMILKRDNKMDYVLFRLLNLTKISSSMYSLLLELVQYLSKHILGS